MTSHYTPAEIERFTTPDLDLSQHLRPALSYAEYQKRYLAGPLRAAEWREAMETEKTERARASAGGVAGGGDKDAGPSTLETVAAQWWVRVTTAGGETGDIDIPRPPTGFPPLRAPVRILSFINFACFLL
jgi:hypothetical protein